MPLGVQSSGDQVQALQRRLLGGEVAPGGDCAPVPGVQGLDRVGAEQDPSDLDVVEPVAESRVVLPRLVSGPRSWVVAKSYRPVLRDQPMLLPADHLVWFVLETAEALDTSALERTRRRSGAGTAGYDPQMLFGLLVYAYCQGVRSSRQIERICLTDVAFRVLCAQDGPDHTTIARFRVEAQEAFTEVFSQVLMIAARAGLGRFGTVAIDGTKIRANAAIDANRGREWFDKHVAGIVADADRAHQPEDAAASENPDDDQPDRVPSELGDRTRRRERIQQAAQELAAQHQRRTRAEEEREAGALERRRRSEQGLRSWVASRTDRTGSRKHRRTWLERSPSIRPSSIGMQP